MFGTVQTNANLIKSWSDSWLGEGGSFGEDACPPRSWPLARSFQLVSILTSLNRRILHWVDYHGRDLEEISLLVLFFPLCSFSHVLFFPLFHKSQNFWCPDLSPEAPARTQQHGARAQPPLPPQFLFSVAQAIWGPFPKSGRADGHCEKLGNRNSQAAKACARSPWPAGCRFSEISKWKYKILAKYQSTKYS